MVTLATPAARIAACVVSAAVPLASFAVQIAYHLFTGVKPDLVFLLWLSIPLAAATALCLVTFRASPFWSQMAFVAIFLCLSAIGFKYTGHIVHGLGRDYPLQDELLAAIDRQLGFHWPTMLAWFNARPFLADVGWVAYNLYDVQVAAVPLCLVLAGRYHRLHVYFLAFSLALVLVHIGVYFVPALAAYHFHGLDPSVHPQIVLDYGNRHVPEVLGMRDGSIKDLARPVFGIVTFPSFHAAYAALAIWALWAVPLLRYPALATNVLMIAATPLHGSHHLTDVIGGGTTALLSLVAADRILRATIARVVQPERLRPSDPAEGALKGAALP
jgi:hypothetical protein